LTIGHRILYWHLQLLHQLYPSNGTGGSSTKVLPFPYNHNPGDTGRAALPGALCGGIQLCIQQGVHYRFAEDVRAHDAAGCSRFDG